MLIHIAHLYEAVITIYTTILVLDPYLADPAHGLLKLKHATCALRAPASRAQPPAAASHSAPTCSSHYYWHHSHRSSASCVVVVSGNRTVTFSGGAENGTETRASASASARASVNQKTDALVQATSTFLAVLCPC